MARKRRITKRTVVLTAVTGSLLIMLMELANTFWAAKQTGAATDEAVSLVSSFYLEAMADRRAKTITNLINESFAEMEEAVEYIEEEGAGSQEELRYEIGKLEALLGLTRFALVDEDNIVYTQYTTYTGRSRHPFLAEEVIKDRTIRTVSDYGSSKQLCLALPIPDLTLMGKPMKACFVQFDIKYIVDLLALDDQGTANSALYSKNGTNLSGTELGPTVSNRNFFDAIKDVIPEDALKGHYENFAGKAAGSLTFNSGEAEESLCYVPVEGTGWEMAALIRESIIQNQIRDISERNLKMIRNQVIFTLVAVFLFALVLLIEIRILSRYRIEEEKEAARAFRDMANTDSMTGVRNKHAYSENEKIINRQIEAGELEKLAVVVGDINGLKYVNDTLGHAAGDKLIKDACALICECFSHGAVFRIGGDEFVILLQGKGFDKMAESVNELNQKVESNIKERAVVVSIGYSVLTQEDRQLRDVFERADKMMYERKQELKSMGAPTGRL